MKVAYAKAARKVLMKIQPKVALAIVEEMEQVAAAPFARHPNVKPLVGTRDGFRLRHGDWRVVYRIDRAVDTVLVEAIGPRGGIYR